MAQSALGRHIVKELVVQLVHPGILVAVQCDAYLVGLVEELVRLVQVGVLVCAFARVHDGLGEGAIIVELQGFK